MNPANNLELMITQPDMYVSALTVVLGDKLLLGEQDLIKSFGFMSFSCTLIPNLPAHSIT